MTEVRARLTAFRRIRIVFRVIDAVLVLALVAFALRGTI